MIFLSFIIYKYHSNIYLFYFQVLKGFSKTPLAVFRVTGFAATGGFYCLFNLSIVSGKKAAHTKMESRVVK